MMADQEVDFPQHNTDNKTNKINNINNVSNTNEEKQTHKTFSSKIPKRSPTHKMSENVAKVENIFRMYNNGTSEDNNGEDTDACSKIIDTSSVVGGGGPVGEVNSVAVATKIGRIIQNLGIAESNSDIPSWAKSLIMALGEATTELQYISTDQSEKTQQLQTTITEQSVKINQLEERCHIQEFLMKILQEEKDLLSERIHNFEVQMKKQKKEKKALVERADQMEERHEREKGEYLERIRQLEVLSDQHLSEKTLLLDKLDMSDTSLRTNKEEKQRLLEKIDQAESALDDAMVYIRKNCLLNRDSQQPIGADGKGLDKNADKEAVRNFIHNMLHKDKLSKLI